MCSRKIKFGQNNSNQKILICQNVDYKNAILSQKIRQQKNLLTSFKDYCRIKLLLVLASDPPKGGDYFWKISTILALTSIKTSIKTLLSISRNCVIWPFGIHNSQLRQTQITDFTFEIGFVIQVVFFFDFCRQFPHRY